MNSMHYNAIKTFMIAAGQDTPTSITIPDLEVRRLRAALIMEEAMETVEALGFEVRTLGTEPSDYRVVRRDKLVFVRHEEPDIVKVADGCADLSVVTIGTLVAFGISDEPLLAEVDKANLRKFGPGATRRDDGKWIKPPDFVGPDIKRVLKEQGYGQS